MYLNTSFLTSLGCSIGIHLPKMCASTKFPMFSFVRGSNPRACTNTWKTHETDEKKRGIHEKNMKLKKTWNSWKKHEIHEKNVKFMKKNWNSWKKREIHEKKREIHGKKQFMKKREIHGKKREIMEKNVKFMENNVKFMKRNVQFMKKTWNSWKKRWNSLKKTWNSWKKREIHEKKWNSWKKREIHEKKREIHGKKRAIHEKNVKFMEKNGKSWKKTWNSWKTTWNSWKETYNSWKKREIHEKTVKFRKMYLNTSFLTSLGCSIGIHLPKMCASTKFPMFSFVRGRIPCVHEYVRNTTSMAPLGQPCVLLPFASRPLHTTWTAFVQAKKKRCDASVISSSTLIPFYLLLLTYVSPYLHKTAPHHMNRTKLTPEPITVSSHPSIPLFPPPLPSSFPFLAGLVLSSLRTGKWMS